VVFSGVCVRGWGVGVCVGQWEGLPTKGTRQITNGKIILELVGRGKWLSYSKQPAARTLPPTRSGRKEDPSLRNPPLRPATTDQHGP
jgi:hypothetical protein